jgi:hypothetical protein
MKAESIAKALGGRRAGGTWMACCPAHDDREPSLSIDAIDAAEGVLRDPLSDLQISNSRSFLSVPSVSVEAA